MNELSDPHLAAARRGDVDAFRPLVERHSEQVFRLCWRITRDTALAEDAVQETFYKAWRALPSFDGRAQFSTWLHRIAANAALEQLRRNARHQHELTVASQDDEDPQDFLGELGDDAPDPQQLALGHQLGQRMQHELARMSGLERAAFTLRHVEGESLDVIAETLALNIGQTKQAVFRAVRKLRGALQEWRA